MKYYGKTDIGIKREKNQDCFGCRRLKDGMTVLAVCDGMGGAKGGETASRIALNTFLSACERDLRGGMPDGLIRSVLSSAVHEANTAVYRKGKNDESLYGMGTTLVAALVIDALDYIFIVNVGDSRAYSVCCDSIVQLSLDHSYVQYLIDKGEITPNEAENHPDKHVITRAVGTADSVRPDIDVVEIIKPREAKNYLLLCSDGLSGMIKSSEILDIVTSSTSIEAAADKLIDAANLAGGDDNITVLLAEL